MSAETRVYVKVIKTHEEWIEVSAVTLSEAMFIARSYQNVIHVLTARYEKPEERERLG